MMDFWIKQSLILLGHLFSAGAMLWLFHPRDERLRPGRVPLTTVLFVIINLAVEQYLSPYLREGSLLFQWVLFVLLANKWVRLPLLHSMGAMFCYFSLLLGTGLVLEAAPLVSTTGEVDDREALLRENLKVDRKSKPASTGPDDDAAPPAWAVQTTDLLLLNRILSAREVAREMMVADELPTPTPIPTPPVRLASPTPPPPPTPPASPSNMTQEELLSLFRRTEADTATTSVPPTPTPSRTNPRPTVPPLEQVVDVRDPRRLEEEEATGMVQSRNRSTDPRFSPPGFAIEAVGLGANGKYAIVDGRFVSEGSILRTSGGHTRGWKLIRIQKKQLFWQPLL